MKLILTETQYDKLFNKNKTKLVITESQYNKLFNKNKTKLVITESQYNRLLVESNISKSIKDINDGDAIKLVNTKGDELFFKVIGVLDNALMLVNCNKNSVYINTFFRINSSDIQGGNVSYLAKHQNYFNIKELENQTKGKYKTFNSIKKANKSGDIDDKQFEELKKIVDSEVTKLGTGLIFKDLQENKDTWKGGTFKNVKLEVYEDGGEGLTCKLSPGNETNKRFNIDTETGSIVSPEEESNKDDKNKDIEDNIIEGLLEDILDLNNDSNYVFKLLDNTRLNLKVTSKGSNTISFSIEDVSGNESYSELSGDDIEFFKDPKNIKIKTKEVKDDATGEKDVVIDTFSLRFKRYLGGVGSGEGDGEELKGKSEDFIIYDIKDFEKYKESDVKELSDDEISDYFDEFVNNSEILRDALWRKPNAFLELIGVAKERGILPAEERLGSWFKTAKENALFKEFKTNSTKIIEFTSLKITNKELNEKGRVIKEDKKYKTIVKKRGKGDKYPTLGTNFNDEANSDFYNYRIRIIEELEDNESFKIYAVELKYTSEKGKKIKDLGTGKIKITKVKEKEGK